jgi:hypothetical protein
VGVGDAVDDGQAEAGAYALGVDAFGAATQRFDQRGEPLWGELVASVLNSERGRLVAGGGVVQAVLAPVVGADRVARLLARGLDRIPAGSLLPAQINGQPALVLWRGDEVDTVIAVRIDHGRVTGLYAVRNLAKPCRLRRETALHR